jgi:hypothetical protein
MKPAGAPPWQRLAPLALAVLAAHALLLQMRGQDVQAPGATALRGFLTRSVAVAPEAPAVAAAAVQAPSAVKPGAPAQRPSPPAPQPPAEAAAASMEVPVTQSAPAPSSESPVAPEAAPPAPAAAEASPAGRPLAVAVPGPARMRYELVAQVRGLTVHGHAELDWRHDGQDYEARLSLQGLMLPRREQRSSGRITAEGLAPRVFYDKSRGEQAAHFDREGGRVTFSNNRPDALLAAGTQDRLSVVLQLASLVAGQPAQYPPGTQIAIPTASTRDAEPWIFVVESEEELALPGGAVRALKLLRKPRKEFDQQIELWLAPRMDYAPVRVRLTNPNGDTLDQRWSSTDRG